MNKVITHVLVIFALVHGQAAPLSQQETHNFLVSTIDKPDNVTFNLKEYSPDETKSFIGNSSFRRYMMLGQSSWINKPELLKVFCSLHTHLMPVQISYRNKSTAPVMIDLTKIYQNSYYATCDKEDLKLQHPQVGNDYTAFLTLGGSLSILIATGLGISLTIDAARRNAPALAGVIAGATVAATAFLTTNVVAGVCMAQEKHLPYLNNLVSCHELDEEKGRWKKAKLHKTNSMVTLLPDQRLDVILLAKRQSIEQTTANSTQSSVS